MKNCFLLFLFFILAGTGFSCLHTDQLSHTNPLDPDNPDNTNSNPDNNAPVIGSFTATPSTLDKHQTATLEVTAQDIDQDNLTYTYNITSGKGKLGGSSGNIESFTASNTGGTVDIEVTVNDTKGGSDSATVTVTVNPSWVRLGSILSEQNPSALEIAISMQNQVYIAFNDPRNLQNVVCVKKLSNAVWVNVGTPVNVDTQKLDLELDFNNTPYIVYKDSSRITVRRYTNNSWQLVGAAQSISIDSPRTTPDLEFTQNNTPYLAFADYGSNKNIRLMRFNGSEWVQTAPLLPPNGTNDVDVAELEIDSQNRIFIAFTTNGSVNDGLYIKEWTGSSWLYLSGNTGSYGTKIPLSDAPVQSADFIIREETLFACVRKNDGGNQQLSALEYDPTMWELRGSEDFTADAFGKPSLAFDTSGRLHALFWDNNNNQRPGIMRYNGGMWEYIDYSSFNNAVNQAGVADMECAIDQNDIIYILTTDNDESGRAVVYAYN
ncbi:MAG TPA: hypothetical protein VKS21_10365 [Spirochaetota bacterium]|nr:hypothetical protein [Spirochaetota bacterium]